TAIGASPILDLPPDTYTFTLTVIDPGGLQDTATVSFTVNPEPNNQPYASGKSNSPVTVQHDHDPATNLASISLDGTASFDSDGDTVTFQWKEGDTVLGTSATISVSKPAGNYTFTLTVTDSYGKSSSTDVPVHVDPELNSPPSLSVASTA